MEVIVFAEGQTEEQFIKRVIAPTLRGLGIFLKPQLLHTSRDAKGGAVTFDRLKVNARNTLRQHTDAVLTTFLDLYGLDTSFPGLDQSSPYAGPLRKAERIEASLTAAIVEGIGCKPGRFIPHIQPYEFEGLLFSDVEALATTEPGWNDSLTKLRKIRAGFETPEHINDSFDTKPSRRLETALTPKYHKTRHGPLAAGHVTLAAMERECAHFRGWMDKLRALAQ
ncbi:DUF4276 family protein [Nitrospirillum sp. BR 11828]|uniref:DUF4276 family protein n=1 Tax=Nitrospirillum sp. BR 11828 TaxID=3104325 RepID=UPI002ACA543E|nr:DUF4276 family protein [Nitrospirillum sp. BR 11828]MDZ5649386.1 DUF4276 family protein [Nitrospirillum sp. BR 11828]